MTECSTATLVRRRLSVKSSKERIGFVLTDMKTSLIMFESSFVTSLFLQ